MLTMKTIGVYGFDPPSFLRRLRKAGVGRRTRRELGVEYTRRHTAEIRTHA